MGCWNATRSPNTVVFFILALSQLLFFLCTKLTSSCAQGASLEILDILHMWFSDWKGKGKGKSNLNVKGEIVTFQSWPHLNSNWFWPMSVRYNRRKYSTVVRTILSKDVMGPIKYLCGTDYGHCTCASCNRILPKSKLYGVIYHH